LGIKLSGERIQGYTALKELTQAKLT